MNVAIIFAGGYGKRMNSKALPKQFLELNGKPIIVHTIEKFENHNQIDEIVLVCIKEYIVYCKELLRKFNITKVSHIVSGGKTGHDSRYKGLKVIWDKKNKYENSIVLLHDGVRPLIDKKTISENIESVMNFGSAITTTPAIETITQISDEGEIKKIYQRESCQMARAPQSFYLKDIMSIHERAIKDNITNSIDSASLMRKYNKKLYIVEGPVENIKITTPSDFHLFRGFFEAKENAQIWGIDYD